MFFWSLLRFYPGGGRMLFVMAFVLMALLGHRLMGRFLRMPGRSRMDAVIPVILALAVVLLLYGCALRWFAPPAWVENLLLQSGRIYPLGAIVEGLLTGLALSALLPWITARLRRLLHK